jgi:hypothetical protein
MHEDGKKGRVAMDSTHEENVSIRRTSTSKAVQKKVHKKTDLEMDLEM